MTTIARPRVRFRPDFYLVMSVGLVALVAYGFSQTVPGDFSTPGFPPFLAVHGAVFAAWMLLFVAQPALVAAGKTNVHRTLGWLGVALAFAMVTLGGYAILFGLWSGQVPPFYPHGLFLIRGTIELGTFAGLVVAGIVTRRKPHWHKRLLLCATVVVTLPALERALPLALFGTEWSLVVDRIVDAIFLIGPVVDLIERRRVHPAYLFGVGAVLIGQTASNLLAPSPIVAALLHALGAR
jgi:hypothetical protein